MTRVVLTEDSIVATSIQLIEQAGSDRFTLRRLGEALGADPTAIYRHFKDKDELLRAVGDRIIADITVGLPDEHADWRTVVTEVCLRLRAARCRASRTSPRSCAVRRRCTRTSSR